MTKLISFVTLPEQPAKKLVWTTDLHMDAADKAQYIQLFELIKQYEPDDILIGGDICNGAYCFAYLKNLEHFIRKPIYFVLGNHDFYYGSIVNNRKLAQEMSAEFPDIQYLTAMEVVELSPTTALVGHDGWADARAGDFIASTIMLNDYFLIEELRYISPKERMHKLNVLGFDAAANIKKRLNEALEKYLKVIVLTHVPPFRQACRYDGRFVDDNWAPHYVSIAVGEVIQAAALEHPNKKILVLCGHTHSEADVHILPNLHVVAGKSELGVPSVQGVILVN